MSEKTRDEKKTDFRAMYANVRKPLEYHQERLDFRRSRMQDELDDLDMEIEVLDEMIRERQGG